MTDYTIVAFGDSITAANEVPEAQRWPSLLQQALAEHTDNREVRVINAGVGGNTSREGLARINDVLASRPALVLVEFGGNDATPEPERHVPVEEFITNLSAIHHKIQHETNAAMVLVTFPPVVNAWTAHNQHPLALEFGGVDEYIERYRQSTRDYARQHNLTLADIDLALRQAAAADGWERHFLPDGVHLTAEGNRVVYEAVHRAISDIFDFAGHTSG